MTNSKDRLVSNDQENMDQEIMARFRSMRQQEAAVVPVPPSMIDLKARAATIERSWVFGPAPKLAVAASVLFAVVFLFQPRTEPDAGLLYADIMAGSSFTTDPLLSMTPGVSPEMEILPSVYQARSLELEVWE